MPGSVGIARQCPDAGTSTGLVKRAISTPEQVSVRLDEVRHWPEAPAGDAVAAAYARAFLQLDGLTKAVPAEHFVRDLPRLLQADGRA